MKVIFLDHDGVTCLSNNWGSRFKKQRKVYTANNPRPMQNEVPVELRFDDFDKKAVALLNSIIEETDAEIVISSDWRVWATLEEMGDYYENQGIIKRPLDYTKTIQDCRIHQTFVFNKLFDLEQTRHIEILQWLYDHPQVNNWVAVDDLHMGINYPNGDRDWGLENFVWTSKRNEGIKQCGIKEKIIKYLKP